MIEAIKELTEASKSRHSRAALPFVGTALSYLFGTATEGNLKQLRWHCHHFGTPRPKLFMLYQRVYYW